MISVPTCKKRDASKTLSEIPLILIINLVGLVVRKHPSHWQLTWCAVGFKNQS